MVGVRIPVPSITTALVKSIGKNPQRSRQGSRKGPKVGVLVPFPPRRLAEIAWEKSTEFATGVEIAGNGGCSHTCSVYHYGFGEIDWEKSTAVKTGVEKGAKGGGSRTFSTTTAC